MNSKPIDSRERTRLEYVNEIIVTIILYHLLCFTDFVDSPETQYYIGYSHGILLVLLISLNLAFILYFKVYMKLLLYYKRR
jgi:hypothetical protein